MIFMNKFVGNILLAFGVAVLVITSVLVYKFDDGILPKAVPKKVGFITLGDVGDPGWNSSHYNGMKTACDQLGIELVYRDNVAENSGECPKAVEELARENVGMIFLNSYGYAAEIYDLVRKKYPDIAFVSQSGETTARNLTTYFAKMYQGRYLAGMVAGMRTKSNVVGYVAAIPNCEVCRGINSFTLGVQRVKPKARVVVAWTNYWEDPPREKELTRRLIKEVGADVLTYHQDEKAVAEVAEELGVDFIGYNEFLTGFSDHNLTSVFCKWDVFYSDILRRYLKGELYSLRDNWIGMERGVIGLSPYSPRVTPVMREVLEIARQKLTNGDEMIFVGEIYDRTGKLRCPAGEFISEEALLSTMTWLVKGVEILGENN